MRKEYHVSSIVKAGLFAIPVLIFMIGAGMTLYTSGGWISLILYLLGVMLVYIGFLNKVEDIKLLKQKQDSNQ
jgi:hypothetical protein